jgi:hypothetical protein
MREVIKMGKLKRYTNALIFSGYDSRNSKLVNRTEHKRIRRVLEISEIPYKQVIGVYRGSREKSFIIADTPDNRKLCHDLCVQNNQDSFAVQDQWGVLTLQYLSGGFEVLGKYESSSYKPPKYYDSYTYDPATKTYFYV